MLSRPRCGRGGAGARSGARLALWGGACAAALLLAGAPAAGADERADVLRLRAEQLAADDDCEQALEVLERARAVDASDARAWRLAGRCQLRLQRYGAAADSLARAAEIDPRLEDVAGLRGIALYHTGDLEGARAALERARDRGEGDPAEIDLYTGLVLLQQARVREAAVALERARRAAPGRVDPVASYYAGLAWRAADERERAEEALRRVTDEHEGTPWAREAERALERRRTRGGRPWALVRVGLEYDDNVVLRGDDVELPGEISDEEDGRAVWYGEGGAELFRRGPWSGGLFGSYYGSAHFDLDQFDTHRPTVGGWVDRELGRHSRARLRADVGYAWVDYDDFLFDQRAELSFLHDWGDAGETELFVGQELDNFFLHLPDATAELNRDGLGVGTGVRHYLGLLDGDLVLRGGYRFQRFRAESTEYDFDAHRVSLGATAVLPLSLTWEVEGRYTWQPFEGHSILEADPGSDERTDQRWEAATTLRLDLTESWAVSAAYSYVDVDSTVGPFDYDRHIVGGYLTFRFN